MDQKFITGGTIITGILLTGCGLLIAPLAVGMILSYPDQIWLLGLVLVGASVTLIYSGVMQLIRAVKAQKETDKTQEKIDAIVLASKIDELGNTALANDKIESAIKQKQQADKIAPVEEVILAKWQFSAQEWNRFLRFERKERKLSNNIESILILLLGGFLLRLGKGAGYGLAFGISGTIAVIYWVGKYYLNMGSFGAAKAVNDVIITPVAVIINGKYNVLRNDSIWLSKALVKNENGLDYLELTYDWSTRKGNTFEDLRIPIPAGKLADAEKLAKVIMNGPDDVDSESNASK